MLAATEPSKIAATLFIDIAVVVLIARCMGAAFKKIRQPAVVGEILAGIMLGPTLLGALPFGPAKGCVTGSPGGLPVWLFPCEVRPFLRVVAELGLIIFMFIVGLELDLALIRGKERLAAMISFSSVLLPFALGCGLALALHGAHDSTSDGHVDLLAFALFIGASMSVTAFPVLARILTERGMYRTEIGALALACAAVDDILAWSLLAIVSTVIAAESGGSLKFLWILLESVGFVAFMFVVVKPQLERLLVRFRRDGRVTPDLLAAVLVGILVSSFITDKIGIHSIFGAFLFGTIIPRKDAHEFIHQILERLEHFTVILLLPVFFVTTGLGVNIRGITGGGLVELFLILLVACTGKFVGATAAARAQGLPIRKASAIGTLMNTRGLTELIILTVGRDAGILDDQLFTLLVVMAIATTVMTEPILRLVYPDKLLNRDIAEAERVALGLPDAYRVLVDASYEPRALLDVATALVGRESPAEVVLSRFLTSSGELEVGLGRAGELVAITESMEVLNELSSEAGGRGLTCVARTRFSDDPARDLLAQALATEADVILIHAGDPGRAELVQRLLEAAAPCDVVVVLDPQRAGALPGGRPLVLAAQDDSDGPAAIEVAVRLARSDPTEIRLVESSEGTGRRSARRMAAWAEQARAAGAVANPSEAAGRAEIARLTSESGPLVVSLGPDTPAGGSPWARIEELSETSGGALIAVRGGERLTGITVEERLRSLAQQGQPAGAGTEPLIA